MKEYKVIAMSEDELISFLKQNGIEVDGIEIEYDMGNVCILDEDGENINEQINSILVRHFKVDKLYMFCPDTDQRFSDDIMIMLDSDPYES